MQATFKLRIITSSKVFSIEKKKNAIVKFYDFEQLAELTFFRIDEIRLFLLFQTPAMELIRAKIKLVVCSL